MKVLGITFGTHDASACLVEDGRIIKASEQERYDHIKHSSKPPKDAMKFCLEGIESVDYVACSTNPEYTNIHKKTFLTNCFGWKPPMSCRKDISEKIKETLGINTPIEFVNHHLCHAASTFFPSPFKESAILTIDGMGNYVTHTFGKGKENVIKINRITNYPWSLGLVYGAMTQFLGFRPLCDECKVMGLASYGKPKFVDFLKNIVHYAEKDVWIDLRYFSFHEQPLLDDKEMPKWYSRFFPMFLGEPRKSESEITQHHMDLACSVQKMLEDRVFQLLKELYRKTHTKNLCLAGGVALNSTLNGKIRKKTPFKNLFITPASNDGGLSIGAALYVCSKKSESFEREYMDHSFFGDDWIEKPSKETIMKTVKLLKEHKVVGWFQGKMEFGPRSLGNRSILAHPGKAGTKDYINKKVKFRETFRPFAPVVLWRHAKDYFEMNRDEELPFMLQVVKVKKEKKSVIPAVTHVDGTARVQTLGRKQNPPLYELLEEFYFQTGLPVLLNTSLNVRGDTIARTPEDAIKCFDKTGMDALVVGDKMWVKE